MKNRSNIAKFVGAGVLAIGLAIAPSTLPAHGQADPSPNNPTVDTTPFAETQSDNNNWGWLGLIGLIGLANLFRKSRPRREYDRPDVATHAGRRDDI